MQKQPRSTDPGDVAAHVEAGGQWCATNRRWFQTRGNGALAGACDQCRGQVGAESGQPDDQLEWPGRDT